MKSLEQIIQEAENNKVAIGHFNISSFEQLKAIFEAGQELSKIKNEKIPLIIGTSEGEGNYVGFRQAAALVKSLKEEFDYPIFTNADHIHSLEKIKEAAEAGYDAVIFDASELTFEENIKKTKEAVEFIKSINPEILVEGEIGFIGSSSKILKEIPKGAAIKLDDLTKPEEAKRFIEETKVDLLSPAVGNIHGMFLASARTQINADNISVNQHNHQRESASMAYMNPSLDIQRIRDIKKAVKIPLVLHGGSGVTNEDFIAAIDAGISIIHINTEIRLAWRQALQKSLEDNPEEIAPYKIMSEVIAEMKKIVAEKLRIFNKI